MQLSGPLTTPVAVLYYGSQRERHERARRSKIALGSWLEDLSALVNQVTPVSVPQENSHTSPVLQTGTDEDTDVPHVKVFKVEVAGSSPTTSGYAAAWVSVRLTAIASCCTNWRTLATDRNGLALDGMLGLRC